MPTDKKDRSDDDSPFLKLSNGALDSIERGWYRESTLKVKVPGQRHFYIQCTTWKDKKQVMFLHTNMVGPSTILITSLIILLDPVCMDAHGTSSSF